MGHVTSGDEGHAGLEMLVGLEISAVCFVRDYVELHFDGPVLRALTNPWGMYGCRTWRFPEGQSTALMRYYIGKTVDGYQMVPGQYLAIDSGEHRFAIPLDDGVRTGPEAAHLLGVDEYGQVDPGKLWIW